MAPTYFSDDSKEQDLSDELVTTQSERLNRLMVAFDQQRAAAQDSEAQLTTRITELNEEQRRSAKKLAQEQTKIGDQFSQAHTRMMRFFIGLAVLVLATIGVFAFQIWSLHQQFAADVVKLRSTANQLQQQLTEYKNQNVAIQKQITTREIAAVDGSTSKSIIEPEPLETPVIPMKSPPVLSPAPELKPEPETKPVPFNPALELESTTSTVETKPAETLMNTSVSEPVQTNNTIYSLQLIGFYSLEELKNYAKRVPLPEKVYYQTETYRGRPWFVLIHSVHPSYASAQAEMAKFPPALAQLDLWIRKLPADAKIMELKP